MGPLFQSFSLRFLLLLFLLLLHAWVRFSSLSLFGSYFFCFFFFYMHGSAFPVFLSSVPTSSVSSSFTCMGPLFQSFSLRFLLLLFLLLLHAWVRFSSLSLFGSYFFCFFFLLFRSFLTLSFILMMSSRLPSLHFLTYL